MSGIHKCINYFTVTKYYARFSFLELNPKKNKTKFVSPQKKRFGEKNHTEKIRIKFESAEIFYVSQISTNGFTVNSMAWKKNWKKYKICIKSFEVNTLS